jgi:hypothetical protein
LDRAFRLRVAAEKATAWGADDGAVHELLEPSQCDTGVTAIVPIATPSSRDH